MRIEPQQNLSLVYQLDNAYDTNTYYVRAVIMDSQLGTVIQNVNLVSRGNGRFSETVLSPKDPTGLGRFIDVTITVYTDDLYTTKSDTYSVELNTYLVKNSNVYGGGGGMADTKEGKMDWKKMELLIEKVISAIKGIEKTNLTPVLDAFEDLSETMSKNEVKFPKTINVDHTPVLNAISEVLNFIKSKNEVKFPKTINVDHTPVLSVLDMLKKELVDKIDSKKVDLSSIENTLTGAHSKLDTLDKKTDTHKTDLIKAITKLKIKPEKINYLKTLVQDADLEEEDSEEEETNTNLITPYV